MSTYTHTLEMEEWGSGAPTRERKRAGGRGLHAYLLCLLALSRPIRPRGG